MGIEKGWKGRLVDWVEKASFERISRQLEVSERESPYKVLLTLKNLAEAQPGLLQPPYDPTSIAFRSR